MAKKIIALVGTYRKRQTIDSAVDELLISAQFCGAETEKIYLLDKHIEFCTNCRNCTQEAGTARGNCVINDDMKQILNKIDSADCIVLAAPINWFNVTALMKKFIERLICYGYWPWNGGYPKNRIKKLTKKAVLITSSSAPAWFGRIFFHGTFSVLKAVSKGLGAKVVRKIYIGGAAISPEQPLSRKYKEQACAAGKALAN